MILITLSIYEQELMSAAKRREGAFNCIYRAVTASSKVIRYSMSILGLSAGYVIRRAAHTVEVLAIYGHSTAVP